MPCTECRRVHWFTAQNVLNERRTETRQQLWVSCVFATKSNEPHYNGLPLRRFLLMRFLLARFFACIPRAHSCWDHFFFFFSLSSFRYTMYVYTHKHAYRVRACQCLTKNACLQFTIHTVSSSRRWATY